MRILITNDDGIHAEGITALEEVARSISDDVWVIAPSTEQSGVSHSLTMSRPLNIHKYNDKKYSVDGTPTDCILVAVKKIMRDSLPDIVISGINHGSNIAEDVTYSGTVSAAMEATILGIPAIAFSQRLDYDKQFNFDVAKKYIPEIVQKIYDLKLPKYNLTNVNFPCCRIDEVKGIKVVPHGRRKLSDNLVEYKSPIGKTCYWLGFSRMDAEGDSENDLRMINNNYISITPLSMDLTNYDLIKNIKDIHHDW